MGDFNAHIGIDSLTDDDRTRIGSNLLHHRCNTNGLELKNLIHCLRLKNYLTFSRSPSVRVTWFNRRSESQIDHVLMSTMRCFKHPDVKAFIHSDRLSDHKLIVCTLKPCNPNADRNSERMQIPKPAKIPKLDIEALKTDEEMREKYQRELDANIHRQNGANQSTPGEKWSMLAGAISQAACKTLPRPTSPMTPRREIASRNYVQCHQKLLLDRNNSELKKQCNKARKEKRAAFEQHFEDKVQRFLEDTEHDNGLDKMVKTFRFINTHRRKTNRGQQKFIHVREWEMKIKEQSTGISTETIPETDNRSPGPEPTRMEIANILAGMRNNSAPGLDGIVCECLNTVPKT